MSDMHDQLEAVTGVQLAQGIGHQPAQGFWTEAWAQVLKRSAAVIGLCWVAAVAFFAIFAPLIASGHPLLLWTTNADGNEQLSSPLIRMLTLPDVMLIVWGVWTPILFFWPTKKIDKPTKLRLIIAGGVQLAVAAVLVGAVSGYFARPYISDSARAFEQWAGFKLTASLVIAVIASIPFILISIGVYKSTPRVLYVLFIALITVLLGVWKWSENTSVYRDYRMNQSNGQTRAIYTLIPFSPDQSETPMFNRDPMSTPLDSMWDRLADRERINAERSANFSDEELAEAKVSELTFEELRQIARPYDELVSYPIYGFIDELHTQWEEGQITSLLDLKRAVKGGSAPVHLFGTDTLGQDVFSQMLHACRLSISIGFVSTGIAVVIGVTIGAIMGYFGGWVDLLLYRVVEIFMAIPVLFLLIVAAGVLPRNIYVMMAIIGCFSWTTAARFIRAEFMKLKGTDYVQAANALGLPLWSILFKHMLPNGVTPVLVESSFLIAAAILIEAILSFLGLGPANQASWGTLLSNASGETSDFLWWLAIFPGGAIFLTTMAYNLIGEALRDAIDPKLKKARV